MGFFDMVSSWFTSNKHTLPREQRAEMERLLDRMRLEMHDNINSATSNTSRRLEELMNSHSRRLNSNMQDQKQYFTNEITRLSNEMEMMRKKQQDEDEKKKKEKKQGDAANENKMSGEYKVMLEMMKLLLEQQKSTNSCAGPPSGFSPHFGYAQCQQPPPFAPGYQNDPNQWQQPLASAPEYQDAHNQWQQPPASAPGYENAPPDSGSNEPTLLSSTSSDAPTSSNTRTSSSVPPASSTSLNNTGIYPTLQLPASSIGSNVGDFPKKLVLPDKRDYKKYGIEHEGKDLSNSSKKLHSSQQKLTPKNRSSVIIEPKMKMSRHSSLGQLKSTSKSSANLDSQLGCGLILPDSRDYNKLITASIQKKLGDEEFEKMVDNFSQEFRPGSKSNSGKIGNNEKKIADGVKNFFLKDQVKPNKPKQRESRSTSSNASVKEWLKNNENYASDDDSHGSDISEVSVRTDTSKFSSVSATSGKRVFWNKTGNYGKPNSAVGSSQNADQKNKFMAPNTRNVHTNQTRYRKMKNDQKDWKATQKEMNVNSTVKEKHTSSTQKDKHWKRSNSHQKDSTSETSNTSAGGLSEIHYPIKREAERKNMDLFKPLDRVLLFLGKNEEDGWTSHQPKCLNDIYDLEKKYTNFKVIAMA